MALTLVCAATAVANEKTKTKKSSKNPTEDRNRILWALCSLDTNSNLTGQIRAHLCFLLLENGSFYFCPKTSMLIRMCEQCDLQPKQTKKQWCRKDVVNYYDYDDYSFGALASLSTLFMIFPLCFRNAVPKNQQCAPRYEITSMKLPDSH